MISFNFCGGRALRILIGITMSALLLAGSAGAVLDVQWSKTFGGTSADNAGSAQQISDGGYILAGSTNRAGSYDAWLIKTDANGGEQWNKTFGGVSNDFAESVQQTSDGGYILTGGTNSYGAGSADAWLIKTNANGGEQWRKTFGGMNADFAYSVEQTSDGGYILAGTVGGDARLIKTDANGGEQWNKTFGGTGYDFAYSVEQTSDGGYILAGTVGGDAWLIKTDANGGEQWNKTFGGTSSDTVYSVQQTSEGGYILAGYSWSWGVFSDAWIIKTGVNGEEQWRKTFGGTNYNNAKSVQQTSDGGYLAGGINSYGDAWLIKTDANGGEQWNKTLGGTGNDFASYVQQTYDGGYILAGITYSYGGGGADAWLVKFSADSTIINGWSKPVNISMTSAPSNQPDIVVGPDNKLHAVWIDNDEVYYSTKNGDSWSSPINISNLPGISWIPRITIDNINRVHVVWVESSKYYTKSDIYYTQLENGIWSTPISLASGTGYYPSYPYIDTDKDNNPHIIFTDFVPVGPNTISSDVFYMNFDGLKWSSKYNISNSPSGDDIGNGIVIDANNNIHIIYSSSKGIIYKKWDGYSWSLPIDIANYPGELAYWAKIAIDQNGKPNIVWTNGPNDAEHSEIYYANFNGATWASPVDVSNSANIGSTTPSIAIDKNNNIHVFWEERNGWSGKGEIYYSYNAGNGWSIPINISNTLDYSYSPTIATDNSKIHVMWTEGIGTNSQIFYSYNTIPTSTANQIPNLPTELNQFKSDGTTQITVGGATDERTVVFSAKVSDPDGDNVKLQVELRRLDEYGGNFDETQGGLKESDFVASGSTATDSAIELIDDNYHWRARTVDEHGKAGDWIEFGGNLVSYADFTVAATPIKIAFVSMRDDNEEIYVMNEDGSGQTRITYNTANDSYPYWSPDARKMTFTSNRDGNWDVYVMNADGSGQTDLTRNPSNDGYAEWSPDGQRIVFVSDRDSSIPFDTESNTRDIYTMDADGNNVIRLTDNPAEDAHPSWSPDGQKIAFASDRDGHREIYIMNSDGSGLSKITNTIDYDDYPTWSPDGTKIAFASSRDSHDPTKLDIYIMNANGTNVIRLTNNIFGDRHPSWSPDGDKIAFVSDRDGNREIYVMNADGSGVTRLTNTVGDEQHPAFIGIISTVCSSGCDYSRIQDAINASSAGDTILVYSGTYYENVNVTKRLTLRGVGMPVVDAGGSGSAITLAEDGIILEGFAAISLGTNQEAGIKVVSNDNVLIGNNASSGNGQGIFLYHSRNNTLNSNNAVSNIAYGIYLSFSDGNTIIGNNALDNTVGIFVSLSKNNKFISNNVSNVNYGIYLGQSDNNSLSGNNASGNAVGIFLGSKNNTLTGNNVSNNGYGIDLYYSVDDKLIGNNVISNSLRGIYLGFSNNITVAGNNVSNNAYGIYLEVSNSNKIYHNNLINNTKQAYDNNGNNWDSGYPSGGNNWSDYTGIDSNSDGIGDTPYPIPGGSSVDRYPLMAPYADEPPTPVDQAPSPLFPDKLPKVQVGGTVYRWYKTIPNSEIYIDSIYLDYSQPDENGIFNVRVDTTKHAISNSIEISTNAVSLQKNGKTISIDPTLFNFRLEVLPREYSTSWFIGDSLGLGGGVIAYVEGERDIDFKMTNSNHDSILEMNRDKSDQLTVGASANLFEAKAGVVGVDVVSGDVNVKVKGMQGSQVNVDYENADNTQKLEGALYILTSAISLNPIPLTKDAIDIISASLSNDLTVDYYESGAGISTGGGASLIDVDIGPKRAKIGNVNIGLEGEIGGSFKDRKYPDKLYPNKYYQEYLTEFVFSSQGLSASVLGNDVMSLYPGGSASITGVLGKHEDKDTIFGKLKISSEDTPVGIEYKARELTYDYGSIFDKTTTTIFENNNPSVSTIWQNFVEDSKTIDEGASAVTDETRGKKAVIELPLKLKIAGVGVSLSPGISMGQANNYVVKNGLVHNHNSYSLEEYYYDSKVQGSNDLGYIVGSLLSPVGDILKNSINTVQEWAEGGKEIILDAKNKAFIFFDSATQFFTTPFQSNILQMSNSQVEIIVSTYTPNKPTQLSSAIMNSVGISSAFASSMSGSGFVIGNITDLQPYNLSFTPAAKLSLNYTGSNLAGIDESNISIFRWNITNDAWIPLPSTVNATYKNVSAMITDFGTYAIGYDNEKPMITWNSSNFAQGNITINAYLRDNGSGINETTIKLYLNNSEQNYTYNMLSGLLHANLNTSAGNHNVKIIVEDTSGNSNFIENEIISIKPTIVTNLTLNNIGTQNLELSWISENGTHLIKQYLLYRNGEFITNTTQTNFTSNNTDSATYAVYPIDVDNNIGIGKLAVHQNSQLVPLFTYDWNDTLYPTVGNPILFNANNSYAVNGTIESNIIKFQWIFDEDKNDITSGKIVNHIFTNIGYHNITLEIEDNNQIQGNLTKIIYITQQETAPSQSITEPSLHSNGTTWLNFTWTNPSDPDFSHVMLYLNGTFKTNIMAPQNYHNFTGLTPDTLYELATHSVDSSGNVNETWVNATGRTLAPNIEKINFTLPLKTGWNMVSLPIIPDDQSVTAIFGSNVTTVYGWTGTSYELSSTLEPRRGYWALSNSNYDVTVTGAPVVDRDITLTGGWNMVGPVTNGVMVSSLPNVTTIYGWTGTSYTILGGTDTLTLTRGYWMLANATSTIQV